jgi:hypothetical protein
MDVKNAVRSVLAGCATVTPESADGNVEMNRQHKIAYDTEVRQRSATMVTIQAVIINGDDGLRTTTYKMTARALVKYLSATRPTILLTPADSPIYTFKSLAKCWVMLEEEAKTLSGMIERLV